MNKERLIPLIVATALFMENMDSTVIATSLPAIAADIGTSPLTLKLAITSYLLSLAVFIPANGWTADRFGARIALSVALRVDAIRSEDPERFALYGLVLAGIGLGGIAFGLSIAGLNLLPWTIVIALIAVGSISMTLYVMHARRTGSPVLDFSLLRLSTMRASIVGGFLFRLGIGALPFLLPPLMPGGFPLSPFPSPLVPSPPPSPPLALQPPPHPPPP